MARKQQILEGIGGAAPAPSDRKARIASGIRDRRKAGPAYRQARMAPNGGVSAQNRQAVAHEFARARQGVGGRQAVGQGRAGLGQAEQPGLGSQLTRRVQAGAITTDQAQQVSGERDLLEQAYGPNWRVKVYGDKGYAQRTRQGLKDNPDDPRVKALYEALMKARKDALEHAKKKVGVEGAQPVSEAATA